MIIIMFPEPITPKPPALCQGARREEGGSGQAVQLASSAGPQKASHTFVQYSLTSLCIFSSYFSFF